MVAVATGSWWQLKYLTHFCLMSMLATKFADLPENTNRQNFATKHADTTFMKKRKTKLSMGNYQPEAGGWAASGYLP